jgi:hypothetical protein
VAASGTPTFRPPARPAPRWWYGSRRSVTPLGQTFSAGAPQWTDLETSEELIARADRALYAAKHAGRNRTEVGQPAGLAELPR